MKNILKNCHSYFEITFVKTTKKYFQDYAFHACRGTAFELATLGNDAGMYGGAASVILG